MANARARDARPVSLDGKLNSRIKQLKYVDGSKPKFVWSGSKEELGELIFLVFEKSTKNESTATSTTCLLWSEDPAHKMFSCKSSGLTFKLYETTKTLVIQGKDEQPAKVKLFDLIRQVETNHVVAVNNNGVEEGAKDHDDEGSVASVICLAENEEIERPSDRPLAIVVDQLVKEIHAMKKSYEEVSKRVDCLTPTKVNGEDTIIKSEIDRLFSDDILKSAVSICLCILAW